MNGTLFLEPFGGLGNRMRTVVSAVRLAKLLKKHLKIIWKTGDDFNCDYEKLFKAHQSVKIYRGNDKKIYSSYNSSKVKNTLIEIVNRLNNVDHVICEQDLTHTFYNANFDVDSLRNYNNIYIRSCEQFYGGNEWSVLQPIDEIQNNIKNVIAHFGKKTIGLHIRRTDNGNSIKYSPLKLFIELMEEEKKLDEKVLFFIATDDQQTQLELLDRFSSNKIIIYQKEFSRSNEKGIQDALVDLFCLSNCSKIIGSYWSSFTEVASYINGTEMKVARLLTP